MRTRHALTLIATAITALVIGGGTAGTVLAASQGAHTATVPAATSVSHGGGIQLDRYFPPCNPSTTKCP